MNSITLASAEEAFHQWRAHRTSRVETIPENLWNMALGLYPEHKRSNICHRLSLNGGQFKRRLEDAYPAIANNGFVLASSGKVKANPKPSPEVQLSLQGKERTLTFCIRVDALLQILPHIGTLL